MKKQAKHTKTSSLFSNLENYQSINVEKDWVTVREKAGMKTERRISTLWRVAAIAVVILGLGLLSKQYILSPEEITIRTVNSHQEVILPDGSQVHLNSNSRLTYPEKFKKERIVSLSGEGYFDVQKNPKHPFKVHINNQACVEVLGTSFNINALKDSRTVNVQVVEGKVSFSPFDQDENGTILVMNEEAVLINGEIRKSKLANRNFLSWKTGIIHFNQESISKVLDILGKHYERNIILDPTVDKDLVFTSTIDNQELEDVLEELSLVLELGITYNPDAIIISKRP